MSTFFIFLLLLICILLSLFDFKKARIIAWSALLISYLVIGGGLLPAYLLYNLQSPYSQSTPIKWEKTNTIILLGAGTSQDPKSNKIKPSILAFSRITQTATLYRECKKTNVSCHILISGGDPLHNGKSEAEVYQGVLLALGVNSKDLQLETQSKNTYQNSEFSSLLLKKQYSEQLLLVNSGLTLKRSLLYFSFFKLHPKPIAADFITIPMSQYPLGYNFAMNDFAIHEYIGILHFYICNVLGWAKNNQR